MASRATWKGLLKISLVTIPIKVYPATESSDTLAFNQLHNACQSRIHQKRWCETCEREVPSTEIVKGFEFEKGRYVILSDADFAAVQPLSARVIDLMQFAPVAALDPLCIDRSYYVGPDGRSGAAYAVVCEALEGKVGVGTLAIYGREYLVAVRVLPTYRKALVLHTLHHDAEIRALPDDVLADLVPGSSDTASVKLARQVIAAFTRPLDLADFQDEVRVGLQRLIDAKIAGDEIVVPTVVDAPPVVNLRDALTRSLLAVTAKKKMPARPPVLSTHIPARKPAAAATRKRA